MSSKFTRFFRVVLTHNLESGTLELPRDFMNEQGKHLSKNVCLIVPTGAESKMELKRTKDKDFLHKGWLEFAEKYSIENRSILVFKYEGGSRFIVKIFDMSSAEIIYPVTSQDTGHKKDNEMDLANEFRKLNTDLTEREERVLGRAMAFESPNPHFMISMTKSYVSRPGAYYLYIKGDVATPHFPNRKKSRMFLNFNGKTWPMVYTRLNGCGLKVSGGWSILTKDNNLEAGDICVFEVVNKKEIVFNVTIFRIDNNDKEEVEPIERTDFIPTTSKNKVKSAMKRVMNRAESFKSENPNFRICITSACIGSANVEIPRAHSRRYIKEDGSEEKYIVFHGSSGRTWAVDYCYGLSNERSTLMKVYLTNGWIEFVEENHLEEGDCCIFEMIMGKSKAYEVTIYRVGDHA